MQIEAIEAEVMNLPLAARSHLLNRLISSLDADEEWERAWVEEAERRNEAVESGKSVLLDGEEVIQGLLARLRT